MTPGALTSAARTADKQPPGRAAVGRSPARPEEAVARPATAAPPRAPRSPRPPRVPRHPAPRGRAAGHRPSVRRTASPGVARRVSGPLAGWIAGRSRQTLAQPRPRPLRTHTAPLPLRVATALRALPDHALLDRIIRGRVWIPLLGVLLAGIVAMQVEVLKLNAGIGRSLERGTSLQSQNELLRASVAELSDDGRIERLAAAMGMVMPEPTQVTFLTAGPAATARAPSRIRAPEGTAFAAQVEAARAAAVAADPTLAGSSGGAASTGTTGSTGDPASTGGVASTGTGAVASAGATASAGTTETTTTGG